LWSFIRKVRDQLNALYITIPSLLPQPALESFTPAIQRVFFNPRKGTHSLLLGYIIGYMRAPFVAPAAVSGSLPDGAASPPKKNPMASCLTEAQFFGGEADLASCWSKQLPHIRTGAWNSSAGIGDLVIGDLVQHALQ
jgi:hypothetical protein